MMISRPNVIIFAIVLIAIIFSLYTLFSPIDKTVAVEVPSTALNTEGRSSFVMPEKKLINGIGSKANSKLTMAISGNKVATEIDYGVDNVVGYLQLSDVGTTTKIFTGTMFNSSNNKVNVQVTFVETECRLPDGSEHILAFIASLENRSIGGCADLVE